MFNLFQMFNYILYYGVISHTVQPNHTEKYPFLQEQQEIHLYSIFYKIHENINKV